MGHASHLSLAALLLLSAACQPRAAKETGMAETGSVTAAGSFSSDDEAGVKAVDEEWAKAANAGNGDGIAALYASDAALLPPGEAMVKGEAAKKYWTDFTNGYSGKTELTTTSVEGNGDLAVAVGTYRMALTPKKAGAKPLPVDEGKYIEVLKRQSDGSWKIVYDIWNPNAPAK